jgi:hypothetical protein
VDGELVFALNPGQVSIAADRSFLYAIEEWSSVIHVYDRKTKKKVRTIGEDGGGYTGPWRKDRLVKPTSCALDSKGYLWVTEKRFDPKRITKWDVKKGTCVYEKIGSERYGTPGGGMDGEDIHADLQPERRFLLCGGRLHCWYLEPVEDGYLREHLRRIGRQQDMADRGAHRLYI